MRRSLYTTGVLAALAAWAAGQGPAPGETAGERMARFSRNRGLVESLVARGLELATADDPLARAKAVHETATDLAGRIREATAADDPVRTAELTEYLAAVADEGMVPVFADARTSTPANSPHAAELTTLISVAAAGLDRAAAPIGTKATTSTRVRNARGKLAAARGRLDELKAEDRP